MTTILTMVGVAVGLGNVWRFPYMMGSYGGSAFLFVYLAFVFLFGIPAVLVRVAMDDVPSRSETKVVTVFQNAVNTVEGSFKRHAQQMASKTRNRLTPLPTDSVAWINRINPTGRKAPGGGFAILLAPNDKTGAVGLVGNEHTVTITIPAYRSLTGHTVTITRDTAAANDL